jgi:hypothetical protein
MILDPLAQKVKEAWQVHADAIGTNDDIVIRRAYIEVLKAELAIEVDCLANCKQPATRLVYEDTITYYKARIEDEERDLAKLI